MGNDGKGGAEGPACANHLGGWRGYSAGLAAIMGHLGRLGGKLPHRMGGAGFFHLLARYCSSETCGRKLFLIGLGKPHKTLRFRPLVNNMRGHLGRVSPKNPLPDHEFPWHEWGIEKMGKGRQDPMA